jgi:hypothetical protein
MNKLLNKKLLVLTISVLTFLVSLSGLNTIAQEGKADIKDIYEETTLDSSKGTHTVLGEYGTTTWCPHCPPVSGYLYSIYQSGSYDFYYISMIADVNTAASARCGELGISSIPDVYFDAYTHILGNQGSTGPYMSAINSCSNRAVADVDLSLDIQWLGGGDIQVKATVHNNEASTYSGHIHAYITEIVSRWNDNSGSPYHFGLLDYAINQNINVNAGSDWTNTVVWDGSSFWPFADDNIMVVAAVYDPSTGYVDEATGAMPSLDNGPPEISNVNALPEICALNEDVQISADVIDDVGVDEVCVIVQDPDDGMTNNTMSIDSGDTYVDALTSLSTVGTYSYYIWTKDVNGNQNTSDVNTFQVMDPHISSLLQNWNFVSLTLNSSIDKSDIIVHYNAADHSWADAVSDGVISDFVFGWNRLSHSYAFATTFYPGEGYWIFANQACELKVPVMNAHYERFITILNENWNVVGSGYCESFLKDDTIVHYSGIDNSWADAVSDGVISDFVFGWDRSTQSYTFADNIDNGEAYWFYASQSCSLLRP